jgi:uncharacterized membrane protein
MSLLTTVVFVGATLATGLLAGLNLGSAFARRASAVLQGDVWITAHQAEDAIFSRIMPPFLISTIVLSVLAAILASHPARWLFAGSALLVVFDLVLTVTRLVPLNRAIANWLPSAPPDDWRRVRSDWSGLHGVRTGAVIVAAILATVALAGH